MTRWLHPPELERQRERDRFDPVIEGARHGLTRELSLAIWDRVCADATDGAGRRDTEQAGRRFHEIAARIAARGGRLRPDVGRFTRVGTELDGTPLGAWSVDELAPRTPGRQTLVAAEARRWKAMGVQPAAVLEDTEAGDRSQRDVRAPDQHELPHASEVAQALASLLRPSPSDRAKALDVSERAAARRRLDVDLAAWSPPEHEPAHEIDREPRDGQLPAATLERMERAYGQRFDDVEIHADSAEVPAGQQAFTRGRHIYFERRAFEPESDHGEHVIAHELAHVAQQTQPTNSGRPATRVALEADAHQAALAALAGRAATVSLFAPPSAALGFSNGEPPQRPASAPGPAGRPPAQSTRGSTPAPSGGATHTPGATHAPTSAGPGGTSARSGATPAARPAASNAAASAPPTVAAPHRGANADGLLIPEAPGALSPAAAGRLQTIRTDNQGVAAATTTLPSGEHQTDVARAAVVEPQAEQDANAQHGVVASVDDRPPPSPEIEAACARIREVIKAKRPPDEDKLVDAKPREMAQEAGNQMSAGVEQRAGTVRQGYADMQQNPQGTPSTTPVPATLPPARVSTPPVDAAAGAPDPLHHDDVSLDNDVAAQKQRIQDAGMDTEPAKLVKDGPIGDAHGGADDLQHMAKTDPDKVLADQAAAIAHAQSDMHALQAAAEKALASARSGTVAHIATHTTAVKGSEEQQRAQAGAQMQAIFTRTQKSVDTLLQPLSGNAVARWEAGVAQLSTDFETSLADVKRRIDERHSGVDGFFAAGWDWATGLPDWVTEGYDRAEAKFADGATNLIRDISRDVNAVIEDCKKLIDQARKDIEAIVKSLPASLQTWAQGEAAKLNQQLDALDKRVDQTQKGINKDLINHANGAVQEVRERVHDLREKAKGAIGKIAAAIVEFAKNPAKAIVNGLLRVLGIPPDSFWSMVDRLGDVVGAIAKDPVKFGKTLISGAGQGFKQFFEHFPTHLKEILMGWLFGTLGTAGVPMPTDFSGPGIMVTVLGIVGIDTGMISSMLGADVSDPAEMAEVHQELAGVLSGDPHALVNLFREHFDPASLIPMIKEAAMGFLIQALITQVAPRIAAMLVPGGAILQAVEAIFKVLMWVVNNAARIFTLIESLVATAGQAVAGNVSGVAAGVESGLVQIIVLVIDFLAGYIGLAGLGAKLKGVIMKVSGKLKGILKKVLDAIKKRAKAKAKTKHDHASSPSKKPDGDHAGPTHGKPDDRDPQKAKDEAKDPRNHKADPDDKDPRHKRNDYDDNDPRNHHKDDDQDPRNHKPHDDDPKKPKHHDDDRDPKKHKDGDDDHDPKKHKDDDEPKKKHEHDLAEARRAARAAANRGWAAARNATEREVKSKAELKSILAREEHSTPKVKIDLDAQDRGKAWNVEVKARVDKAHATESEGSGWIARGDGNQPWYAARDLDAFNRKLLEGGFAELKQASPPAGGEPHDGRALYDDKVSQGKQIVDKLQHRLDGEIRGLKVGIEMEPWSGVKQDHLIDTELSVKPNTNIVDGPVPAGGDLQPFEPVKLVPPAEMDGGTEDLELRPSTRSGTGHATLWIDGKLGTRRLSNVLDGDLGKAVNPAGRIVVNDAFMGIEDVIGELEQETFEGGQVSADQLAVMKQKASKAVKEVSSVGKKLQTSSLANAEKARPMKQCKLQFKKPRLKEWKREYRAEFLEEMKRQLTYQQEGLNKLTIDRWVINREIFSPSEHLNEIHELAREKVLKALHERATKVQPTAEARLADLVAKKAELNAASAELEQSATATAAEKKKAAARAKKAASDVKKKTKEIDGYIAALEEMGETPGRGPVDAAKVHGAGGRVDLQGVFAAKHEAAKKALFEMLEGPDGVDPLVKEWEGIVRSIGELVVLHDPDQIAGGEGSIQDDFPMFTGDPEADVKGWRDYLKTVKRHLGVHPINGSIGSQWKEQVKILQAAVVNPLNPQEVYGIRTIHVLLKPG